MLRLRNLFRRPVFYGGLLGGGMLLQTGGCTSDVSSMMASSISGLLTSIITQAISGAVNNAFNIGV